MRGGPTLAGFGLSLATMASLYYLVFCSLVTVIVVLSSRLGSQRITWSRALLRNLGAATLMFLALSGWLLCGVLWSYKSGPYVGAHDAARFSANVQSFFLPNAVNVWAGPDGAWRQWTQGEWASSSYIGYVGLALAAVAAWRIKESRWALVTAGVGALLALGPFLKIGEQTFDQFALPYGWVSTFAPFMAFSGLPARFSWLTTFGVALAAAAVLAELSRAGRLGVAAVGLFAAAALVETWPKPLVTTAYPRPSLMEYWAQDTDKWVVLDASGASRALWHQTIHRHPMVGGYVSRLPADLWVSVQQDPMLREFVGPVLGMPAETALLPAPAALDELHRMRIRFVVVKASEQRRAVELGLLCRQIDADIAIYEVPAPASRPS
jgi:hypothetical protein